MTHDAKIQRIKAINERLMEIEETTKRHLEIVARKGMVYEEELKVLTER